MRAPEHFIKDAERFNRIFAAHGAIVVDDDGVAWIDCEKLWPGIVDSYRRFLSLGHANGWIG